MHARIVMETQTIGEIPVLLMLPDGHTVTPDMEHDAVAWIANHLLDQKLRGKGV